MSKITLRQSDISVAVIEPNNCPLAHSDECTDKETHVVMADFRIAGYTRMIATGCLSCCESFAACIQESLPEGEGE